MARFQDIIGQEQIKEHLRNAITAGKVSHAYIINGEKSSGKEFIAKVFAMALQCEKREEEPCQECHSCKQALTDNHPGEPREAQHDQRGRHSCPGEQ